MNIVLCGMMGSGKTTVARVLHNIYGLQWLDTDDEIVKEYGSINGLFATLGEEGFRNIESAVTKRVAQSLSHGVISVGGGCVLRAENVSALKSSGRIYYLRTSPQTVIARLKGDDTRPLLQGGLEQKVNSISAARSAIYEAVCDNIVDTDALSPEEVARQIKRLHSL